MFWQNKKNFDFSSLIFDSRNILTASLKRTKNVRCSEAERFKRHMLYVDDKEIFTESYVFLTLILFFKISFQTKIDRARGTKNYGTVVSSNRVSTDKETLTNISQACVCDVQ